MTKPADSELMQHADGELGERAADVSGELERDPTARAKAEALGELRELVRGHLELAADEVDDRKFQAMWREVGKAIEAPVGVWSRIGAWFDRHRGHLITGAVSAGAVAALALILRPGDRQPDGPGGPSSRPSRCRCASRPRSSRSTRPMEPGRSSTSKTKTGTPP